MAYFSNNTHITGNSSLTSSRWEKSQKKIPKPQPKFKIHVMTDRAARENFEKLLTYLFDKREMDQSDCTICLLPRLIAGNFIRNFHQCNFP